MVHRQRPRLRRGRECDTPPGLIHYFFFILILLNAECMSGYNSEQVRTITNRSGPRASMASRPAAMVDCWPGTLLGE